MSQYPDRSVVLNSDVPDIDLVHVGSDQIAAAVESIRADRRFRVEFSDSDARRNLAAIERFGL